MPRETGPTLEEQVRYAKQDLKANVTGLTRVVEDSTEEAVVVATAGGTNGVHKRVDGLYDEIHPATCSERGLGKWGDMISANRRSARFAEGTMLVFGTAGSVLPEGAKIQRDDGTQWQTLDEETVDAGETWVTPNVRALTAGKVGNFESGEELSLVGTVSGFSGEVDAGVVTREGLGLETIDAWRNRVNLRFKRPRLGGGPGDFEEVCLANGATRAWEFGNWYGDGTVLVLFVDDTQGSPIPTPAKVDEIQAGLMAEFTDAAQITAGAPVERKIHHHIALNPNTVEMRELVSDELRQFYRDKGDVGKTVQTTGISAAIQKAGGLVESALLVPSVPVVLQPTELPTLGTVAFSTL